MQFNVPAGQFSHIANMIPGESTEEIFADVQMLFYSKEVRYVTEF
jgi:hypothetical protein